MQSKYRLLWKFRKLKEKKMCTLCIGLPVVYVCAYVYVYPRVSVWKEKESGKIYAEQCHDKKMKEKPARKEKIIKFISWAIVTRFTFMHTHNIRMISKSIFKTYWACQHQNQTNGSIAYGQKERKKKKLFNTHIYLYKYMCNAWNQDIQYIEWEKYCQEHCRTVESVWSDNFTNRWGIPKVRCCSTFVFLFLVFFCFLSF